MNGLVKVQMQEDKRRNLKRYFVYLPAKIVKMEKIEKGNVIDIDIRNSHPEYIEEPRSNFKNENTQRERPKEVIFD